MITTATRSAILFDRQVFLEAFTVVATVVPARSPKAILTNVLLRVDTDSSELIASDLEIGLRYRLLGVESAAAAEVILPTARFTAILNNAEDDQVALTVAEDAMTIRGKGWHFKLAVEDPAQFPDVPRFDVADYLTVAPADLRMLIRRTRYATDVESTRYALGGTLLEAEEGRLKMIGTDGRRLARQVVGAEIVGKGLAGNYSPVLPVKGLKLIERVLDDEDPSIQIGLRPGGESVVVRTGQATVYSRLVEGRFPRYQDVFPGEFKSVVTVEAGLLLAACKRASITTSEESRGVDFAFKGDTLKLSSQAADVGKGETELEISTVSGGPIQATLDPRYLVDALSTVERAAAVRIELIDARNPILFEVDGGFSYVVMPLSVNR